VWKLPTRLAAPAAPAGFSPPAALALLLAFAAAAAPRAAQRPSAREEKGGIYLLVAVRAEAPRLDAAVARTVEVMQARCLKLFARCDVRRAGEPGRVRVKVEAPRDPARVKAVLLAGGMEMRPVVSPSNPYPLKVYRTRAEAPADAGEVLPYDGGDEKGGFVVVERTPVITGDDVRDAHPFDLSLPELPDNFEIFFNLKPEGATRFAKWTGANVYRYVAVVLDGRVRTAPYIVTQMSDAGVITGRFTRKQALDTALVLASGNLPAPLELIEEGTYKPTGDA
jgi:preprotein translocase subunit SecD